MHRRHRSLTQITQRYTEHINTEGHLPQQNYPQSTDPKKTHTFCLRSNLDLLHQLVWCIMPRNLQFGIILAWFKSSRRYCLEKDNSNYNIYNMIGINCLSN